MIIGWTTTGVRQAGAEVLFVGSVIAVRLYVALRSVDRHGKQAQPVPGWDLVRHSQENHGLGGPLSTRLRRRVRRVLRCDAKWWPANQVS